MLPLNTGLPWAALTSLTCNNSNTLNLSTPLCVLSTTMSIPRETQIVYHIQLEGLGG